METGLARATSIPRRIRPVAMLAWALSLTGATVFLGVFVLHSQAARLVFRALRRSPGTTGMVPGVADALVQGLICLIPAFWMGAVFPLALAVSSNRSGPAELVAGLCVIIDSGRYRGRMSRWPAVIPYLGLHGGLLLIRVARFRYGRG